MSASLNDRPNKVEVSGDAATVTAGAGVQGAQGDPGIIISATEPTETDVLWADTSAAGSMVVPAGGSTGQALVKASGSDYDTSWSTISAIAPTIIDAKGDLIVGTAADTPARLAVGATNGHVLTVNSAQAAGVAWSGQSEVIVVAISDETTNITTGAAKVTFRMPFAMTLTAVRASLSTASSSGTPTFDINESGVSVLSTLLTIDANELTSTTAAVPAVISDSALADDAPITVDIDVAGTGAKGAKVYLIGRRA